MRICRVWAVSIFLFLPSSSALSITRNEVIGAAQNEADYSYSSCLPTDTSGIMDNVYHYNYFLANTLRGCSPVACILVAEWPFVNGWPQQHTWSGAPYCYGGTRMGGTCQSFVSAGKGVGATPCQHAAMGETNSWAAGIDCSHFVCTCLGIPFADTSTLPSQCKLINWDDLQKGDLLICPGSHVMMFKEWEGSGKSYYTVIHASLGGVLIGANRVWKQTGRYKLDDQLDGYSPYTPNVIAGDPAAALVGFRAVLVDGVPQVMWETECERETRAFWVERASSTDGPWLKIAESVAANGFATAGASYVIVDATCSGGEIYYRLVEQEIGWRTMVKAVTMIEHESNNRVPSRDRQERRSGMGLQ